MAKKTIKAQMKQRRDTKANWASTNPVLLDGELGIVSDDPNLYKVGDGTTAWNALPFRGFDGTIVQEIGASTNAVMSQKAVTDKITDIEKSFIDLAAYDVTNNASHAYITQTGGTQYHADYWLSDNILVREGDKIIYSGDVGPVGLAVIGHKADGSYVEILGPGMFRNATATIPAGVINIIYCGKTKEYGEIDPSLYISARDDFKGNQQPANLLPYAYLDLEGNVTQKGIGMEYGVSDYIAVEPKTTLSFSGEMGKLGIAVAGYNEKKEFTGALLESGQWYNKEIIVPERVYFVRYSGKMHKANPVISLRFSSGDAAIGALEETLVPYPTLNGYYVDLYGRLTTLASYNATQMIAVNEGDIFYYSGRVGDSGHAISGYDNNRNFIKALLPTGEYRAATVQIPEGVSYIRACGANARQGNYPALKLARILRGENAPAGWWYGKKVAIIGDSISTNGSTGLDKNVPEIEITSEDVGQELKAYVTYYDIQNGLTINGVTYTSDHIGKEITFYPSKDDIGKVIGLSNNYNDSAITTWWERAADVLKFRPIPVTWSGSSMSSHEANLATHKCAHAWHESQIRKCGIRKAGTMDREAPDVIIIYRGTNDFSHSPYTILDGNYLKDFAKYPITDVIDGGYGFMQAYALTISKLRQTYPNARIVVCTLNNFKRINYGEFPVNNGLNSLPEYNNAIRSIADFFGCGLIEFDKDGITYENCYSGDYVTDSSSIPTHPNDKGHFIMGEKAVTDLRKFIL